MSVPLLPAWADMSKPVIGMLHLPALPGAPGYAGSLERIRRHVLNDAAALVAGGVHGLLLENFGDAPFYPGSVPPFVVAHMTRIAREVRQRFDTPLGINVLRNDGCAALAIAHAAGAEFVRVNVLCGARLTDQGIVRGIAHKLMRQRTMLAARDVRIFADVNVKHSAALGPPRPLRDEVVDLIERGGAEAVIVTGTGTGQPVEPAEAARVKAAAGEIPIVVGSGVRVETIAELRPLADGFIVGTALKRDGIVTNSVDPARVRDLIAAAR